MDYIDILREFCETTQMSMTLTAKRPVEIKLSDIIIQCSSNPTRQRYCIKIYIDDILVIKEDCIYGEVDLSLVKDVCAKRVLTKCFMSGIYTFVDSIKARKK